MCAPNVDRDTIVIETTRPKEECHISNVSMKIPQKHDMLVVNCKISGRRANMLIDSGSTHDFISESFICWHNIATQNSSKAFNVTLSDGSVIFHNLKEPIPVEVVVKDFGETQSFTAMPLHR